MASTTTCCTMGTTARRRMEAAQLGKMLEPYQLFWLEDCTPAENQEAFKLVRQHTTTPLAVGEIFNTIWDAKDLIQNQLIDYIRATIVGAGGVTHLRRIADLASAIPGPHRLPRCHRPVAGHDGHRAAFRHLGSQLRHPGIHAPHALRLTPYSRTTTALRTG